MYITFLQTLKQLQILSSQSSIINWMFEHMVKVSILV